MFYISYFYMIRYFPENLVPVSTAVWDHKWYHNFKDQNYIFFDNRHVLNGVRCQGLAPTQEHIPFIKPEDKCGGHEHCLYKPEDCNFLKNYEHYLHTLDFNDVCERIVSAVSQIVPNPNICLMVHEKYDNVCSERVVLRKWFEENGSSLPEWKGIDK